MVKNNIKTRNQNIFQKWRYWRFKNTLLLFISLVGFYFLTRTNLVDNALNKVGSLGYFGAVIAGIFFVSTFTVAPAAVVIFHMAEVLHPLEIALLSGFGAMIGDYFVFRYVKDRVFQELLPIARKLHTPRMKALFKSPYFIWILPVVGAFVIASPLPDEVGVGMMGMSKIKRWQFFVLAFVLNAVGIFIIVSAAAIK
ncbi:hypothetical protein KC960_01945 [Candidatus Saccharibacteria bacterium]|nr:hypothetical protein [Candidatus Saccharibacteria bacterium]